MISTSHRLVEIGLRSAIVEITHDYLLDTYPEWRKDAGSYGTFRIHVDEGTFELEIFERIMRTQLKQSQTRDIQTGSAIIRQ